MVVVVVVVVQRACGTYKPYLEKSPYPKSPLKFSPSNKPQSRGQAKS